MQYIEPLWCMFFSQFKLVLYGCKYTNYFMNEVYFWQYFENKSLIFAHWGDNVVIANLVQTQLRLSPNRSRTFQLASTYLRRTLNLSSFYLPSTLPLFCIYQKTKKSTFSTIINFELSIVNSKSSELWIVILRWTFPLATFLLSPCYPLTTPLLSAYFRLAWMYLESSFLLSTFFLPSSYLLPTFFLPSSYPPFCIYQKNKSVTNYPLLVPEFQL